ncbi:hypothetical protein R6Q59_017205 [Mikania micrantha]
MTKSISLHCSILLILILFAHLSNSEAKSFRSLDSTQILRKLGYDISKFKHDNRRLLTGTNQIAPGGPDPQHHKRSPNMP